MNITEYFSEEDNNPSIYRGRMTLKEGYNIADADESCYRYLGMNSALPFTALAHPGDAASVKEALEQVKERPQHLIFRLRCRDESYRYMYALMRLNGRMLGDFASIDVELLDIMRIHDKYDDNFSKLVKYRKLMSLSDKMYFEYSYEDGTVTIYEYLNERSVLHFKKSLELLQEEVLKGEKYNFRQKAEFEALLEYLKNYSENIDMELDGELFGLAGGYLRLRGGIVYRHAQKWLMAAAITATGESKRDEKYYMSQHAFDNATSVYNKRAITELTMDLISGAQERPVFFSIIDIDDFKNLNDTYGHMAGDEILAKVAETLRSTIGDRGYVGRFGGDEFVVVTDRMDASEELLNAFKTIRKHIAWMSAAEFSNVEVTTSIGIARYPEDADNYESLFKIADKCLYLAKAKGKNRFILYQKEIHKDFELTPVSEKKTVKKLPNFYFGSCRAVVDILGNMGDNDRESFDRSVSGLLQSYEIDRLIIYAGEDYERKYFIGGSDAPMDNLAFIKQPQIAELFDANGVFIRNKILALREIDSEFYELLEKQGTEGFLVVKIDFDGQPPMAVAFGVLHRYRKWSENEKGLLYIAAQIIARRYLELEHVR